MSEEPTNPPARSQVTQVTQSPTRPVTAVTAGTRIIGTYEVEKLINSGGMGEVYRGRNIHNGEAVAIKIVLPHLANDEMITQLFQKEAKVLGRLFHEAIVRYHVFTNDPEIGRPCIVMEFVEGTSMNEVVKRGPMPLEDVRILLRRLAGALDKAHTVGVVHRDLSPDNVILEDGQVSHAKIIDFGIAKSSMKGDATLLQGQFAGKFGYVAPEQLGAYGGNVDGRTDIYSLGLMMVAVSQGRVLNMGKSIVEAVRARGSVPDLSGVYPEIRPLLEHMLEPNPENRPRSMAQVAYLVDHPDEVPGRAEDEDDGDRTRIMSVMPPSDAKTTSRTNPGGGATAGSAAKGSLSSTAGKSAVDDLFLGIPENKPTPPKPEPKKSGKGGLIAALVVLALGGGGAGAYFSGMLDPKPAETPTATTTEPTGTTGTATTATTDSGAAPTTAGQTDSTATATASTAPDAATSQTEAPATTAEPGTTDASSAGGDQTASSGTGTTTAPEAAAASPDPAAAPAQGTDTSAAAASGSDAPAQPAPEPPPPLDARGKQLAWLETYDAGPCVYLAPQPGKGDLVSLVAFGPSVEPFSALLASYTATHGVEPDIAVRVVNEPQCPVMDLMNRLRSEEALPTQIVLDSTTGVLLSGETVSGRIEGLAGRAVSLFLVNGAGGTTNLKDWISRASDGTVSFKFTVNLAAGTKPAEPTPQLLLAIVTDEPVTKLNAVPNGVTARALVPFMLNEIERARQAPVAALGFFRLEN